METRTACKSKWGCASSPRVALACSFALLRQDQRERDMALNGLKQGRLRVLVATDVAARGLDIKGVGLAVAL